MFMLKFALNDWLQHRFFIYFLINISHFKDQPCNFLRDVVDTNGTCHVKLLAKRNRQAKSQWL